jgi:pseudouridine kinase
MIAGSCAKLGIDLSQAVRIPGASTSSYCYIANPEGEMVLAVSDMEIYNQLTPKVLESRLSWMNSAEAVVLDTNLTEEAVAWLCSNVTVPIFADPVSTAKAVKLRPVLSGVHTLKPNRLEAEVLTGVKISDEESLDRAADALLEAGVKRVFLTLGSGGVLAADTESRIRLSNPGVIPVSTTGCGDAFAAALVWATVHGMNLAECAVAGLAAAGIAMGGTENVNPLMSPERLENEIVRLTELQED